MSGRISIDTARTFLAGADIPQARGLRGGQAEPAFDAARTQAAVVGSEVVSFVKGVTAERREAIVNSSLLAQLVAKKRVPDASQIQEWYKAYFEVLTNVGWVVQDSSFAEYQEQSDTFETHKAILAVAATLLGPASTALAVVTSVVNSLHSLDESTPWITIFNRESREARTAHFQISLAEQDDAGEFIVSLMAFGLEAKSKVTQVLFFKVRKNEARLRHYSGRVTINTGVLDAIRGDIKAKLVGQAGSYVSSLPDLA